MGLIADLFVKFSAQGVGSVDAALKRVQGGLEATQKTIGAIGTMATASFGAASGAILGMAAAGVAQGAAGALMQYQMDRLARTVAGIFRPELEKLIQTIQKFTDWIDRLSNNQKKVIAYMTLFAAGVTIALVAIPPLIAGIQGLVAAVIELTAAIVAGELATGIGAILPLIGVIIGGIATIVGGATVAMGAFLTMTEKGREILAKLADALMPLMEEVMKLFEDLGMTIMQVFEKYALPYIDAMVKGLIVMVKLLRIAIESFRWLLGLPDFKHAAGNRGAEAQRPGPMEGVADTWSRIAQASRLVGACKPVDEQQLAKMTESVEEQKKTNAILGDRPGFVAK